VYALKMQKTKYHCKKIVYRVYALYLQIFKKLISIKHRSGVYYNIYTLNIYQYTYDYVDVF